MVREVLKVLIVDDEAGIREGIKRTLTEYTVFVPDTDTEVRFSLECAENGADAICKIESFSPDILLLDYKLPDISGLELLDKIDIKGRQIVVIMITAYASLETAVLAIKKGAEDFLAKPFTPQEIKDLVNKYTCQIIAQRQARKLAEERREVRFQFISVLAHELKAPLGAVEGYLRIMKDKTLGNRIDSYANAIDRSLIRIEQMRKLIADLLDLTKIESGKRDRLIEEVDVCEVAKGSIEMVSHQAAQKGISVELVGEGDTVMEADKSELSMILNNLITNAIKYNKEAGSVRVRIRGDSEFVLISVEDTGIGIREDMIERIFEDFVRVKSRETADITGSGLGLSIVRRLVRLYDGRIEVKSKEGQGSTFTVWLRRHLEGLDRLEAK